MLALTELWAAGQCRSELRACSDRAAGRARTSVPPPTCHCWKSFCTSDRLSARNGTATDARSIDNGSTRSTALAVTWKRNGGLWNEGGCGRQQHGSAQTTTSAVAGPRGRAQRSRHRNHAARAATPRCVESRHGAESSRSRHGARAQGAVTRAPLAGVSLSGQAVGLRLVLTRFFRRWLFRGSEFELREAHQFDEVVDDRLR